MKDITDTQATAFAATGWWHALTPHERVWVQLSLSRLCMPWEEFHRDVMKTFKRAVPQDSLMTRAGIDTLRAELFGGDDAPSWDEIHALIPPQRRGPLEEPC